MEFYPYTIPDADVLWRKIQDEDPSDNVNEVKLLPVVRVGPIIKNAAKRAEKERAPPVTRTYHNLVKSGIAWADGFLAHPSLTTFALGMPIYTTGIRYDPANDTAVDVQGKPVVDPVLLGAMRDDAATIEIFHDLSRRNRGIVFRGLIRGPDVCEGEIYYKFRFEGNGLDPWGKLRDLCKDQATVGQLQQEGFVFPLVVADRCWDAISYDAHIDEKGKPTYKVMTHEYPLNELQPPHKG
ncbi:hypothetical protein [Rhizobium etli]|uniref:hypothetical protein n=1 Tax=Rhizobium etli TaxID=29449 RepID=UPI0012DB30CE|nr:hypothetical protein [Rhizobium etli]